MATPSLHRPVDGMDLDYGVPMDAIRAGASANPCPICDEPACDLDCDGDYDEDEDGAL